MKKIPVYTMVFASAFTILMMSMHITIVKANPLTINISPSSAPVGSTVTISGTNATSDGEVRIYAFGFIFLATTKANATGDYSVNITAPSVPYGIHLIMAVDMATSDTALAMLSIQPRIILSCQEGSFNSKITVKGDGFSSGSNISLTFDGMDITPTPRPMTNFIGSFEANFHVPSTPNGTYTITAKDLWANSASASFRVVPKLTMRGSGVPSTLVFLNGFGFAPSLNVTVHFDSIDVTQYPWVKTSPDGFFESAFFVPPVSNGTHFINASDTAGNWAVAPFVVGPPIFTLTPNRTFKSSIVTAKGEGFPQYTPIILKLENITMTQIIDMMLTFEGLMSDEYGAFEYSFIVPITESGIYTIGAYAMAGAETTELKRIASAPLTVIDNSPIDLEVHVGSIHFLGENAEFYAKTAFNGKLVNATIERAMLYYSGGTVSINITAYVEQVATGFYRIPYVIPVIAMQGTYTLLIEASYTTNLIEAAAASSASFLISPTLTVENAQLANIENQIGTIIIPNLGAIKANLTVINAKLEKLNETVAIINTDIGTIKSNITTINLRVASINNTIATIETSLGTIQGRILLIEGNVTTILTDLGTVKADIGDIASEVTPTGFEIDATTLVLALIAAVGSILTIMFVLKMRTAAPSPVSTLEPPPPPSPPPEPSTQ